MAVCVQPGDTKRKMLGITRPTWAKSPRWVPETPQTPHGYRRSSPRWVPEKKRHTATGRKVHDGFPNATRPIRGAVYKPKTEDPNTHAFSKAEANLFSSIQLVCMWVRLARQQTQPSHNEIERSIALSPSSIDRLHIASRKLVRCSQWAFFACMHFMKGSRRGSASPA